MAVTLKQVNRWLKEPSEHRRLEFKEAKNQYSRSELCRYCVALANGGGGHFVLGIADSPHRVVGTKAFPHHAEAEQEVFQRTGISITADIIQHPDGRVLAFTVPGRPPGIAYRFEGRYLQRVGASTVDMPDDQLRKIFAENQPDWLDQYVCTELTPESALALLDAGAFFTHSKLPQPAGDAETLEQLVQRGFLDRQNGGYAIRRLGALLLARRLSDFPDLQFRAIRIIVYLGKNKLEARRDWTCDQGYATSFYRIVEYVMEQIPQREVIRGAMRQEVQLLPADIVRELLANAMVHQDFTQRGKEPRIEIYSDRIEFTNPGEPLVEVEDFIRNDRARNPQLMEAMRRMKLCERRGSGIDLVIHSTELHQLRAPEFRRDSGQTMARVYGQAELGELNRNDRIRACHQHCQLRYLSAGEPMTNQSLRERFGAPQKDSALVSRIISDTVRAGLIRPDREAAGDSRRFACYLPVWA